MIILTIRTDKPEAEIGLYENDSQLAYEAWHAHRQLAETIHKKIEELLQSKQHELKDIKGIVCFKGPGSFTGLRIGLTVGNTLAYSLSATILSEDGVDWQKKGIKRLLAGESEQIVLPEYGAPAFTTQQKK